MMKLGRWFGCVLLLLAIAAFDASCSRDINLNPPEKKKSIALILKMNHGDYWNTIKMGAEVAAKEFNVKLITTGPDDEDDVESQVELVNQTVQSGVDALILAASDYMGLAQATDRAGNLIPVVSIDSEVGSAKVRSFIGANDYDAGAKAGLKMADLLHGNGRIGVISFVQGAKNADQREEGLFDVLARYPGIEVVQKAYSLSNQAMAEQITKDMVGQDGRLDGIIALNAISSVGVASEVSKLELGGQIRIVAFESTPEVLEDLQEGTIQATVILNPFTTGYLSVKYAVEAAEGKKVPDRVDTGSKVIELENMFWSENQKLLFPFVK